MDSTAAKTSLGEPALPGTSATPDCCAARLPRFARPASFFPNSPLHSRMPISAPTSSTSISRPSFTSQFTEGATTGCGQFLRSAGCWPPTCAAVESLTMAWQFPPTLTMALQFPTTSSPSPMGKTPSLDMPTPLPRTCTRSSSPTYSPKLGGKQTYLAFDHPRFQEIPSEAKLRPVPVRPLDKEARGMTWFCLEAKAG
ncbi:unnamed protein product [Prorocentrum cordatum]|uniref:Uncharacterized protein n=1 Tax=Prorocentrum cordatum TaxID=2364126 RepID=A0ABN9QLC5_9DINO|nr:unnamed protein product [Polarella glacialis]